jgi:hypothetical protein
MIRSMLIAALASALALPALAAAQPGDSAVAGAFMAAARAQDRKAALDLLDQDVSIRFPAKSGQTIEAEGQPFVIGYLDGVFDAKGVSLAQASAPENGSTRFHASDPRSGAGYAIDVEVKNHRVVAVTVNTEDASPSLASN